MSEKLHVLVRKYYGDFDIAQSTVCFVSADKAKLEAKRDELNATRTALEIENCVSFEIDGTCKLI